MSSALQAGQIAEAAWSDGTLLRGVLRLGSFGGLALAVPPGNAWSLDYLRDSGAGITVTSPPRPDEPTAPADPPAPWAGWAIVELMGHRRLTGHLSEETIAGTAFLRLDVPSEPPVTQYYAPAAVYCITPTTEELARAAQVRPQPVARYEIPAAPPDPEVPF